MYSLSVGREFTARHYLTVPNPGPEGNPHAHEYCVEVCFSGNSLDEFGYLVDIDDVHAGLDEVIDRYAGVLLNELPEFAGQNPSVERFAAHFGDQFIEKVVAETPSRLRVRMWEGQDAWASYKRDL